MNARATLLLPLLALAAACGMKNPSVGPTFAKSKAALKEDVALVYVLRYAAEPTKDPATLLLDGAPVVELANKGFTWFYAAPGRHELGARWAQITGQHPANRTLELAPGVAYYVELTGVHRTTGEAQTIASSLDEISREAAEKRLEYCGYQKPRSATPGK